MSLKKSLAIEVMNAIGSTKSAGKNVLARKIRENYKILYYLMPFKLTKAS
jgi:hypothetical protein